MNFQPGANLYTQAFGNRPENLEVPHIDVRNPSSTDVLYPVGKFWLNTASQTVFILVSLTAYQGVTNGTWKQFTLS